MRSILLAAALLVMPVVGRADDAPSSADLTSIGLEHLMQIEVTSVSRHEEPLFRAASAITVLTSADIARSGASNIPELLRTVPGMNVAQINGNTWAISARGFNGQYANKMLVLVDGRTVYNPVFSGVYWDVVDVMLVDVQRIEIIRGPGATVWGANAVNGVINIITKPASAEQGTVALARGDSRSDERSSIRFSGPAGASADFRVFAKYHNTTRMDDLDGLTGHDALGLAHLGGRLDWHRGPKDEATVQGDYYDGTVEQRNKTVSLDPPYSGIVNYNANVRGGNLMGSWQHTFSATSDFRAKAYVDQSVHPGALISEDLQTFDVDFQHRLAIGRRQDLMWGGGYRAVKLAIVGSQTAWIDPSNRTTQLVNLFVQDAITVVPRHVTLTLGSKFEHNDFSGYEAEPSARLLWAVSPSQTVWSAVSRAVRTPGPADENVSYNQSAFPIGGGAVGEARLIGTDMRSEIMTSQELGYRAQITPRLSLDLASFESQYSHLRAIEVGTPFFETDPSPAHMVIPVYFVNGFQGKTRGLEGTLDWRPSARFDMTVSHSLFWMRLTRSQGTTSTSDAAAAGVPTYQLTVQPHVVLTRRVSLDATWYHVDDLPVQNAPAYDRLDARLGWTPVRGFEVSTGVQNLFHDNVFEFAGTSSTSAPTTVRRAVFGKVTWRL